MFHAYWCTDRHCPQCNECLAEGESKYCSTCFDYLEHYSNTYEKVRKGGKDALYPTGQENKSA